jgi:threonine synthase
MMEFCIITSSFWRFNQFVVLHPELNMQESYRELCMRGESDAESKRITFASWWNSEPVLAWRSSTLDSELGQKLRTFNSTRGDPAAGGRSFKEALFGGFASDGGLFVPAQLPRFTVEDLVSMHKMSYPTITKRILREIISTEELATDKLNQIIDDAFATFDHPDVLPLVPLKNGPGSTTGKTKVHIMEMFHGTTGAFKDLSMSIIGRLMQAFLSADKESSKTSSSSNSSSTAQFKTIVVGTSGDTGSAAIHAVRDCPSIDIIVLYPYGRVSKIQELQMITEKKAHVFAVEGTSDDLDVPIKKVLSDPSFVAENQLCSINSINLARVAIQSAHFFYAYAQLVSSEMIGKSSIIASIPCGACGDLVGALMAREMGLPVRLVASVNENDIVKRTMDTGRFQTGAQVHVSTSPSMDIQVPYNWERVVYYASGGDVRGVKEFMEAFEASPRDGVQMDEDWQQALKLFLSSSSVTTSDVASITRATYASDQYILDPHTAVGLKGYMDQDEALNPNHWDPVVILSTATPHKFDESVKPTLGLEQLPNAPKTFEGLEKMETFSKPMKKGEDWEAILRSTIADITKRRQVQ